MNRRLAVLAMVLVALAVASPALAQEHGAADTGKNVFQYLGAAFAIGLAASVEAIGRNPGAVGPIRITMIIGLALIESLVIYALIIAFLILA